ncbi:MORN motif [Trypanosoma melophagium]|uniref:MORN motif n=1 Tax=Trypanosoma melophagium TaxID=715481 RepID=UPI00351A441E|nr:MORN motif [Trypanosoma melophagium]
MFLRRAIRLCTVRLPSGVVLQGTRNPQRSDLLLDGTVKMPDGRIFNGRFDAQHGFPLPGSELHDDGDLYRGEFNAQWQRHGAGEAWLADGTYYKGRFCEDELVEGTVRIPNGTTETVFVGVLRDESFVSGTLKQHDFTYEGEFHENRPHGRGRLVFATGAEQEGTFWNGKLHGSGCKMKLDGGFVYVGDFIDGCIRRGQLYTPTYTYDGEFNEHGRAHGEGTQTYLANEPRLLFTGIWENGVLVRGTCSDEYGAPVDWQDNHALQAKVFADEGEEGAVTMNSYCSAKLKEADKLYRDMNQSYVKDAEKVSKETGRYPSKMDLGYEGSIQQENSAAEKASRQSLEDIKRTCDKLKASSETSNRLRESVMEDISIPLDTNKAKMQFTRQAGAQQLATERIDEQFERFMKTFDRETDNSTSRRIIDGNSPWKAYTQKS